jgi:hypothetical protein
MASFTVFATMADSETVPILFAKYTGLRFNEITKGTTFFKVLYSSGKHHDKVYDTGAKEPKLYELEEELDLNACSEGAGLHFITASQIHRLPSLLKLDKDPCILATVTIPDDAFVQRRDWAYKATKIVLSDLRLLDFSPMFDADSTLIDTVAFSREWINWGLKFVVDEVRVKILDAASKYSNLRRLDSSLHHLLTLDMFKTTLKRDGDDLPLAVTLFGSQVTREMYSDAIHSKDGLRYLDRVNLKLFGGEMVVSWINAQNTLREAGAARHTIIKITDRLADAFNNNELLAICDALNAMSNRFGIMSTGTVAMLRAVAAKKDVVQARRDTLRSAAKRRCL